MMQLEGFSINEACRATGLSRAGFYRHYEEHEPLRADIELRDAIHKIVIENRFYGYRRVTAALNQKDWAVNHKRVLRLMRADNLLALRECASNTTAKYKKDSRSRMYVMSATHNWLMPLTIKRGIRLG